MRDRSELEVDSDLPESLQHRVSRLRFGGGVVQTALFKIMGEYGEVTTHEFMIGLYRRTQIDAKGAQISNALQKLKEKGLAERVSQGVWKLTELGVEEYDRSIGEST